MKKLFFPIFFFLHFSWNYVHAKVVPFHIYHTNDLHSHFDGVKTKNIRGGYSELGKFSRISSAIQKLKKDHNRDIIFGVDAGDFFAGTIFSALGPSLEPEFPEYDFLVSHGFEAMILGNHEYDPGNLGFLRMLEKANMHPKRVPFISTNLIANNDPNYKKYFNELGLLQKIKLKELHGPSGSLTFAFLGALSPNGCLVSRSTRGIFKYIGFDDEKSKEDKAALIEKLQEEINLVRKEAHVVVLSYHGGSEDALELAEKLDGLDILIAGHTHQEEFMKIKNTYVQQTGSYGAKLGFLSFVYDTEKRELKLKDDAKLMSIDEKIPEDPTWKKKTDILRTKAFKLMGHSEDPKEIIFTPKKDYMRGRELFNEMGQLVTSLVRDGLNKRMDRNDQVDVYFTSMGLIRSSFEKGIPYNRADIFEAVSIGFDEELRPGVDIVHFYLTPKEMDRLISFLELYSKFTSTFSPIASNNLTYNVRWWGIPLINRVHDLRINGKLVKEHEGLFHVATNRFVTNNIENVRNLSKGLVDIVPKDKKGEPLRVLPKLSKEYILLTEELQKTGYKY